MTTMPSENQKDLLAALDGLPEEYFSYLLQMIRAYRDSFLLKSAAQSCRQGWAEAKKGETYPVDRLWEGIEGK